MSVRCSSESGSWARSSIEAMRFAMTTGWVYSPFPVRCVGSFPMIETANLRSLLFSSTIFAWKSTAAGCPFFFRSSMSAMSASCSSRPRHAHPVGVLDLRELRALAEGERDLDRACTAATAFTASAFSVASTFAASASRSLAVVSFSAWSFSISARASS